MLILGWLPAYFWFADSPIFNESANFNIFLNFEATKMWCISKWGRILPHTHPWCYQEATSFSFSTAAPLDKKFGHLSWFPSGPGTMCHWRESLCPLLVTLALYVRHKNSLSLALVFDVFNCTRIRSKNMTPFYPFP